MSTELKKNYGYIIVNIDTKEQLIITNELIKDEFVKLYPVFALNAKWKTKKYFRDPNKDGFYYNYKNAKSAVKLYLHVQKYKTGSIGIRSLSSKIRIVKKEHDLILLNGECV